MTQGTRTRTGTGRRTRTPAARASNPLEWFHDGPSFDALSEDQKRQVSEYLDREDVADQFHPLTPVQRRRWERIKRKSRPTSARGAKVKASNGTKVVSVSVEQDLLGRADAYAKEAGMSRTRLVGLALEAFLGSARRRRAVGQ